MREVTFRDFAALMSKRKRTAGDLADIFRGKIEDSREFFDRVMSSRYKGEDRSGVVIPYRSVVMFYEAELYYFGDSNDKHRRCACGCGHPVFDRKKWASPGCRQKLARSRVTDTQKGLGQVFDFVDARL